MDQPVIAPDRRQRGLSILIVVLVLLMFGARTIASTVMDYQWWKEMGQLPTWISMLLYGFAPVAAASLLAFAVLWIAHARGVKLAGETLRANVLYARIATLVLLLLGVLLASSAIDTWAVIRFFGNRAVTPEANPWTDPVFQLPLSFYLFDLPFYTVIRRYVLALALGAAVIYWLTARAWQLRSQLPRIQQEGEFDITMLRLEGGLESRFLRGAAALFLLALAMRFFLGRYEMLWNEHAFMVGADYVDEKIRLPLQWLLIASCVASAAFVLMGRWMWVLCIPVVLIVRGVVPQVVGAVHVRPNEISIQRPYIERHIGATRSAFGLEGKVTETEFNARLEAPVYPANHKPLFDNIRLWDWRAFHDTVTQIQALRPYYRFPDSDVDRYIIDGQQRQVMLSPRELDIRQLPDARASWINPHFIYTHGYGMVMAEANRITPEGLPVLFVKDAPPQVMTKSLKLTRPEIYYGEVTHEPVFVRTAQKEFSYPSGNETVFTRYHGIGGFPISSLLMRLAAAVHYTDYNILLTSQLTPESRMMMRRNVLERLNALAGFLLFDGDPYLVLTDEGRLVWTVDAYTVSQAHPYSSSIEVGGQRVNYIRNSVKATLDAYNGNVILYVFDPADPIIKAYGRLFPTLFKPASEMPADLRAHARYPETIFRAQAEIYRVFHMTDPQTFYNKEDLWDIARNIYGHESRPQLVTPTYVIATLPGEEKPEFMLMLPFTPRNKDNLIGMMVARCDGENLGEIHFLQLSKQALIFGPMQIEARINQDQNISKDLSLWNQQGSQVLRGQMLVLPVDETFVYVEPIYIQAAEARMPQLKKVVMAVGNNLIYRDTYEEALAELSALHASGPAAQVSAAPAAGEAAAPAPTSDNRVESIRQHLRRYREFSSQGKWAEAGKELEAIESAVRPR